MEQKIKVFITDDHAVVRAGLAGILGTQSDIVVVGEAGDGLEAVEKVLELQPDVILMDIVMPRCNGLEAIVSIKRKMPDAKFLILTMSERENDLVEALRLGVQGYILKNAGINEVVDAVRKVAEGQTMLSPSIITRLVGEFRQEADDPSLSARESEVLKLIGAGLTNTDIAKRLFIGESTVRTYLRRLLEKLHLKNRAEAIVYAARRGLTRRR
jgi:DNA-binding NarL/FixJ family response regulator